jgi:Peptidase family S41/N-terminal domain of Peptidase_S41 in eukaryotic IRBP
VKFFSFIFFAFGILAAAPVTTASAQIAPGDSSNAPAPLNNAQAQSIVDGLIDKVQKLYVFPEKRTQIVEAIRADNAQGRYSNLPPSDLANRLSATLFSASNDKHLNVSFDPVRSKGLDEAADPLDHAFFDAEGLRLNQGYVRQEILPGNIRYVRIQMFFWTDKITAEVIDSAAQFLSGGSAVIIDLRGNGGGHMAAVQRLISYLMPAKSTPLMTFFDGSTGKSLVTKSTVKLPSARIAGRPVYVLIDRGSFSAAEEFAYHIQQFKLGTLVGEKTAGGANNNIFVSLPEGFIASVSFGRPIHPVSKTNWEGVGIAPDKAVPGPAALDVALTEALTALLQSTDPKVKAEAEWELPVVKARLAPTTISLEELQSLTGIYGEREIRLNGDKLTSYRAGLPPIELTPMGDGLFAAVGRSDARFSFVRNAPDSVVLEIQFRDGLRQSAQRKGKP